MKLLFVYILEAHATDEWPINSSRYNGNRGPVNVIQPKTNEERLSLASRFRSDFDCMEIDMLVDSVDNEMEKTFAPWPLRFYGIQSCRLSYIANPKDCSYDLAEVRNWCLANALKED